MRSYEEIFAAFGGLSLPGEQDQVEVDWVVPERLAIGRDASARYVLVLAGDRVFATSDIVRRSLVHGDWQSSSDTIKGTLLRVPQGEQFHIASTTIAIELLRRGIETRPTPDVFSEVEAFIELVIRRVLLPPDAIIGLLGELIVLDYAIDAWGKLAPEERPDVCSIWRGYSRQSRDFAFHRLAMEVKTTTGPSSRHHIGGLDQVEPRVLDGGLTEELFLVSVGIAEASAGSSRFSIAGLTSRIVEKLTEHDAVRFLDQLEQYGPEDCVGYCHDSMADWGPYLQRYRLTFEPRVYNMADPLLRLIKRADLQDTCVLPEGISYQVHLPDVVPGSHGRNPRTDLPQALLQLFNSHS